MFYSYDLTAYGMQLRKIRKQCGLSQEDIKNQTGINENTLRRIENGFVIPKYETIQTLSISYNCDLLELLKKHRTDKYFYDYYTKIDKIIAHNQISLVNELILEFKDAVSNLERTSALINKNEMKQFEFFLQAIEMFYSEANKDLENIERILINALTIGLSDFSLKSFMQHSYSLIQIRILLLLGMIKGEKKEFDQSTALLIFINNYLLDISINSTEIQNIILKIYVNISYNYHESDDHEHALRYSNMGIAYAVQYSNMHCLYNLFARRGVAEYLLGMDNYMDSLNKSIQLLEINALHELASVYRKVMYERYKIKID